MPPFGPIKRRELIGYLQQLGFSGPTSRGKHQNMKKGNITLTIPNPHKGDISKGLLARILREAGISREDWERLI
jgi:predicted RNA binding protein YcfA (HicA-like mRNA interferase family)